MLKSIFKPNYPFHPKIIPFYYGWIILIGSVLGQLISIPGQTIGVSVFTDHLIHHLKLSRLSLSGAYMAGTACGAFFLTTSGRFYDRYGGRKMLFISSILFGLSLFYIGHVNILSNHISSIFNLTPPNYNGFPFHVFFLIFIGFFLIRFLGQGTITLISRNILMEWFRTKRGFASGIGGLFVSFSFSSSPLFFKYLIDQYTFQGAWIFLAAICGIAFPIFVWFFIRDQPEDFGWNPDGKDLPKQDEQQEKLLEHSTFTLSEAKKNICFLDLFFLARYFRSLYDRFCFSHFVDL